MSEIPNNPLKSIFKLTTKGKISEEIGNTKNIDKFFNYLNDPKNPQQYKVSIIEGFLSKMKINRYICEFFSSYENKPIYFFLFDLYLAPESSDELKIAILGLIKELILNIEVDKKVFEYIFQKLASAYRGEDDKKYQNPENINDYLKLLNVILSDTENKLPPNNYFACGGDCQFNVDLNKLNIKIGCSFTLILNFKIGISTLSEENPDKGVISNLMNIHFSNGYSIKFDLQYPVLLVVKEIRDGFIKTLPNDEWINLIVNITINDKKNIFFFFYVNGENNLTSFKLPKQAITSETTIKSIDFFNNFYGEVSSITMLSQKGYGIPGVNASDFLQEFKQYKEGIWKKKIQLKFLGLLSTYDEIGKEKQKSQTFYYKPSSRDERGMIGEAINTINMNSRHKISYSREAGDEEEFEEKKKLIENLVFIFTPFNYSEKNPNIVESSINNLILKFSGNIKNHKYQCYQKKLALIGGMTYFFPIADMFLIHPHLLNENNFQQFLEIIDNILNSRKKNMELIKECHLFKILSLFFEKYPKQFFTEKILDAFCHIGKVLFSSGLEGLNSSYFQNILLNEKILSKYSEELQLKFWNNLMLFCQSDSTQMESAINMNSICLILRFYDRNKYTEMCCEKHLSMIKEEFVGNKTLMNPPMNKKLSQIENIIGAIINAIEPTNSIALFKLLTLDLSPCLIKFILNIFTKAFKKKTNNKEDEKWKDLFVDVMIQNNFETIIINTFVHSLPEIRLDILQLMYEMYFRMVLKKKEKKFRTFEKLIKMHFVPHEMFYASKEESSFYDNNETNKRKSLLSENENNEDKEENFNITEEISSTNNNSMNGYNSNTNNNNDKEKSKEVNEEKTSKKINPLSFSVMEGERFGPKIPIVPKEPEINDITKSTFSSNSSSASKSKPPEDNNILGPIKSSRFKEMINRFENQRKMIGMGMGMAIPPKPMEKNKPSPPPETTPQAPVLPEPQGDPNEPQFSFTQNNFYLRGHQVMNSANPTSKQGQTKTNTQLQKKEEHLKPQTKKEENAVKVNNKIFPNVKVEKDDKILILKDEFYFDYLNNLYNKLLLWSFGNSLDTDFTKIKIKECSIKNANAIEMILSLAEQLNDIVFTLNFLKTLETLCEKPESAYQIILNRNVLICLLDTIFKNFKIKTKEQSSCYNKGKSIILNVFINSLACASKNKTNCNPYNEIETFFIWGDKVIQNDFLNNNDKGTNDKIKENLFEFLNEILFECLTLFKIKYEPQMKFNVSAKNFSFQEENIYLKNYFIFISHLYRFSFLYKHDSIINTTGTSFVSPCLRVNSVIDALTIGMKIDTSKGQKVAEQWSDFPFFDDIYLRVSMLWRDIKNYKKPKKKQSTLMKCEEILKKMILDKDKKNVYQKELELFCLEQEGSGGFDQKIIPLIKTIPCSLMCMISTAKKDEDFLYWLKEFKRFVRFLIISSSNLTRTNQQEQYNKIQDKVLSSLVSCLCFMRDLSKKQSKLSKPCHKKVEKSLYLILTFCFIIVKYQYQYNTSHKAKQTLKLFKGGNKPPRNDLSESAIFILFNQYVKDKSGTPILNPQKLEELETNQYMSASEVIRTTEWDDALFENQTLKNKLDAEFFCLTNYVQRVDARYKFIAPSTDDNNNNKYSDGVLKLLPLYEKELMKYSNSSIELNKQFKGQYKSFKKQSFLWRGLWSDRKLFFIFPEKLKLKIINHYTKNLMKPILVPILDVSYYLPKFSGFKPENLFNPQNKNDRSISDFNLIMDIDKILKLSEQNQISMTNIIDSFYEKKKPKKENFFRKIYIKSNPKLAESLSKFSDNLDLGKDEEFVNIEKDRSKSSNKNKDSKKYFLSCLVKTSHHIKGVCFIDKDKINFKVFMNQKTGNAMNDVEVAFSTKDDDYDQERQTCFGSYFMFHPRDKDMYNMTIRYDDIKWIFLKRYYYKNSGLEIFTLTNKSYYFNFKIEEERDMVLENILNKLKDPAKIVDDLKGEEIIGYENTSLIKNSIKKQKKIKMSKKIDQWKTWEITNYEFLMWLNIYGNRSYNDISQYPVFPWVLTDYKYGEDCVKYKYRDLSLPMGMMEINEEGSKRKEQFIEMYETLKESEDPNPYFYGSNYSNPMYVCNFLMRLFPFTHIAIELQGSKFDDPNRLFTSVATSFSNSISQKTDVRELIPEFFYMPEMFLNLNDLNMGVQDNGMKVNDVFTPCKDDPYKFIISMKNVLESEKISNNLQSWVDLIFGGKSRGGGAESANNIYTQASYQENINLNGIKDKTMKDSTLRQVEFGLIPAQLMTKDFGKKEKKDDVIKGKEITVPNLKVHAYKCKKHEEKKKDEKKINEINDEDMVILKCDLLSSDKITLLTNNGLIIEKKIGCDKNFSEEITNVSHLEKLFGNMSEFYSNSSINNKVIRFCFNGKCLIMGGFYDSKIVISILGPKKETKEVSPFLEDSPIVAVEVSKEEEYLFLGNTIGNILVIKIDPNPEFWKPCNYITDQIGSISHIYCNDDLNMWASTSTDSYVNLYTFPLCKLVRSIRVEGERCSYGFLSSSPLPAVITISDQGNNSLIYAYSINGKSITNDLEYYKIINPIIIKDIHANEYLSYVGENSVIVRSLPNLNILICVNELNGIHIICPSTDLKMLYAMNKNASEIYVIKEETRKNA